MKYNIHTQTESPDVNISRDLLTSQGTLSELEKDKYKSSIDTIIAMNSVFNVDLKWLIFEDFNGENMGVNMAIARQRLNFSSLFRELSEKDKNEIVELEASFLITEAIYL